MTLQVDESRNAANIQIEGEIAIESIGGIVQDVSAITDKYATLVFNIRNVAKIDLAGIQFFYAVQKKMKNNGKKITFDFELEQKDKDLIETTGFSELLNSKI